MYKNYVTLTGQKEWQIHFRCSAKHLDSDQSQVVLLHPSPLCSGFMVPIMELLADEHQVVAWDTPGYGQSDSLPEQGDGLEKYVEALHLFLTELGIRKPVLYGSATGAQIAIEYAKAYPENLNGMVLENAAWFTEQERESILTEYFPDISAKDDGSHLIDVWKMVSQLYQFFPWFDTSESSRVSNIEPPTNLKHQTLMSYFTAGPEYYLAYKAAFMNERPEQLRGVTVPTHLLRWQSSILKKYVDRLDDAGLPANIQMKFADAGIENRFAQLKDSVAKLAN